MPSVAPGTKICGYQVLAEIGKGAASELYAVQDVRSKQVYALKQVFKNSEKDQRFLDQCEDEYTIGSKLDHENIRHVYKLIKNRKMFKVTDYVLIMELFDGVGLDTRLPRTQLHAASVFIQVAEGLAHMHDRGFVHADMKPSNVLIDDQWTAKIIDLGQSCPVGTIKKRIQGTPGYMAPEQAFRREITAQTDVYNFGATMYWVMCREVIPTVLPPKSAPVNGSGPNSLVKGAIDEAHVESPIPPVEKNSRIHPVLSKLIMDCVALKASDRPMSMHDVADKLRLVQDVVAAAEAKS